MDQTSNIGRGGQETNLLCTRKQTCRDAGAAPQNRGSLLPAVSSAGRTASAGQQGEEEKRTPAGAGMPKPPKGMPKPGLPKKAISFVAPGVYTRFK